ncbi:SGNH/GDSL hydrolase family protein [Cryobacterium arcticum]|uniref:Uncharacterized protein n=1 Tax=Cryobacterium arcticum TaxID=670052 RepID=A0A1B1BFU1_9MICO|nr:SGNH/GDSL hydrolase family protein [Cryobacterium arcticum]ANP71440.1 hypothetical protein PA27867_0469 [Cryobacterium arcticum]
MDILAIDEAAADAAAKYRPILDQGQNLIAKLDMNAADCSVFVLGDSTGNGIPTTNPEGSEWVTLWAIQLGQRYPSLKILSRSFSDGLTAWSGTVTTLQSGVAPSGLVNAFHDTFSYGARTTLVGALPEVGNAWTAAGTIASGVITTDGATAGYVTGTPAPLLAGTSSQQGGQTVTATGTLDMSRVVGEYTRIYAKCLDTSNYVYVQFVPNANGGGTGVAQVYKRIAGVNTSLALFDVPYPITGTGVQTVVASLSVQGTVVTAVINGTTLVTAITSADATALAASVNAGWLSVSPGFRLTDFNVDVNVAVEGFVQRTLTIWNGSIPGSTFEYLDGRIAALWSPVPAGLDLLVFNSGHNYLARTPADYLAVYEAFVTKNRAQFPAAGVVVTSRNPRFSPATNGADHLSRLAALRKLAAVLGWGYIAALEAFVPRSDGGKAMVRDNGSTDRGIHPTTAYDNAGVTGSSVWADAATRFFNKFSLLP